MRPAGTFATILAVGVIIVLIYQWSGDSIVVLIMCIVTLFAALALWDRKPWATTGAGEWPESGPGSDIFGRDQQELDHQMHAGRSVESREVDGRPPSAGDEPTVPPPERGAIWRSRFNVDIGEDGVTGLELGHGEPRLHRWETIISATTGWSEAIAVGETVEQRLALHLALVADRDDVADGDDVADKADGSKATDGADGDRRPHTVIQLMFGQKQDPERVIEAIGGGMRRARTLNSRFHHLPPAERTRQLASALAPTPITLAKEIHSPELLYQEARRTLLTSHALRRVSRGADPGHVATAVGQLLSAHQLIDLSVADGGPLGTAADEGTVGAVYLAAGRLVEDRGYRLAFIHHGGEDHLLGLLSRADAPDWDGQAVGSGLAVITLDPPAYV